MALHSINEISAFTGSKREDVAKRADQLGLVAVQGPKNAKLYDSRALVRLVSPPSRMAQAEGLIMTPDEARARKDAALAEKTELEVARLKGELADVGEILESQNSLFDELAAVIKKSRLSDDEKEDALSILSSVTRKCWSDKR